MGVGILYGLAAGLMWGLVFVSPLLLPEYPAALLSVGRYLAFGLIALPLAALDQAALRRMTRADWLEAIKLAAVGNLLYYLCLASAIQRASGPLPTMIIGTLPVLIAITANLRNGRRDGRLPWRRLLPSLCLIAAGLACVNKVELALLVDGAGSELTRYVGGVLFAVGALVCWTWYPLRNADWLRRHPERRPKTWATALGEMPFAMPFGPRPGAFVGLMLAIGLFASWLGTLCWNEASQRLPTVLAGQLIVFETLAALFYAFVLRGAFPDPLTLSGIALLVVGVLSAVRLRPTPVIGEGHAN